MRKRRREARKKRKERRERRRGARRREEEGEEMKEVEGGFIDLYAKENIGKSIAYRSDLCQKVPTAMHTIGTAHAAPEVPELPCV
jgi:hypothetical protein